MSLFGGAEPRRMVPRWRASSAALAAGEMIPTEAISNVATLDYSRGRAELAALAAQFTQRPGVGLAGEIVSSALVLGEESIAQPAADFILTRDDVRDRVILELARRVISSGPASESSNALQLQPIVISDSPGRTALRDVALQIAGTRALLRQDHRNALAWLDLGRLYVSLGQHEHARRAVEAALSLFPSHRLIVRSAARFFVHSADPERAVDVVRRSRLIDSDPWILAAEIAVQSVMERSSRHAARGLRILRSETLAPQHVSELAGAVATVEALNGNRKSAERLFRMGLIAPTENMLAQAEYASRVWHLSNLELPASPALGAYEAGTWRALTSGAYDESVQRALMWLDEEPFSSRAAIHGTAVGAVSGYDPRVVCAIGTRGLLANPGTPILMNNVAFALADAGLLDEAEEQRSKLVRPAALEDDDMVAWTATGGLIEFRRGRIEAGRALYRLAIESAASSSDPTLAAKVLTFFAAEEVRARTGDAVELLKRLELPDVRAAVAKDPFLRMAVDRLNRIRTSTT